MLDTLAISLADSALNQWIVSNYWLWPALEILHFFGLSLLLGGLLIVDLRLLGLFDGINPVLSHRFLPWVIAGFAINLLTGLLFFVGDPTRYSINIGFQIKMGLIMLAGLNALFYHWKVNPLIRNWRSGVSLPFKVRMVALTSLTAWTGVLLAGRLIPYVGTG